MSSINFPYVTKIYKICKFDRVIYFLHFTTKLCYLTSFRNWDALQCCCNEFYFLQICHVFVHYAIGSTTSLFWFNFGFLHLSENKTSGRHFYGHLKYVQVCKTAVGKFALDSGLAQD
jgi:hypothetical protein